MSVPVRLPPVQKHIACHIAIDRHDEDGHPIKSPPIANMVGEHYRVGRKIGEGKVGVIYEGASLYPRLSIACWAQLLFRNQHFELPGSGHQVCGLLSVDSELLE